VEAAFGAVAGAAAGAAVLVAVVLLVVGSRTRAAAADERAEKVKTAALDALRSTVETTLARPAQTVLDEHRTVRESALSVRDSGSAAAAGTGPAQR